MLSANDYRGMASERPRSRSWSAFRLGPLILERPKVICGPETRSRWKEVHGAFCVLGYVGSAASLRK
jgi:hypothetical protein